MIDTEKLYKIAVNSFVTLMIVLATKHGLNCGWSKKFSNAQNVSYDGRLVIVWITAFGSCEVAHLTVEIKHLAFELPKELECSTANIDEDASTVFNVFHTTVSNIIKR